MDNPQPQPATEKAWINPYTGGFIDDPQQPAPVVVAPPPTPEALAALVTAAKATMEEARAKLTAALQGLYARKNDLQRQLAEVDAQIGEVRGELHTLSPQPPQPTPARTATTAANLDLMPAQTAMLEHARKRKGTDMEWVSPGELYTAAKLTTGLRKNGYRLIKPLVVAGLLEKRGHALTTEYRAK